MLPVRDYLELLGDFFASGGYVLWMIFLVSVILWTLIIERYVYLRVVHPRELHALVAAWRMRADQSSWFAHKIRLALISDLSLRLTRSLALIKSLIAVCPLLGLLGTVSGMVHVFDVIAVLGTGNARAMAQGISLATVPTVAGLVVALSGLFFSVRLGQQAALEQQKAADLLRDYHGAAP